LGWGEASCFDAVTGDGDEAASRASFSAPVLVTTKPDTFPRATPADASIPPGTRLEATLSTHEGSGKAIPLAATTGTGTATMSTSPTVWNADSDRRVGAPS
jgi:hypothetical protein